MSEWQHTTLGAIATKDGYGLVDGPFGSNLPASCYTDEGIPVIRGSNLSLGINRFRADEFVFVSQETAYRLARSLCRPLDIIFTKKGTLGQTGLIPISGPYDLYLLSSNQMKLTVDRKLADPLFVYYFVSSFESVQKIIRDSEVTGVPKTNITYLRDFPIKLPPLSEQRAIAQVLGNLDDKIELNRRMNETLEAMARALFKDWFVDFGPVRARMRGRQPPGLTDDIAALFPAALDAEGKPEGWVSGHLTELALLNPESWSRRDYPEEIEYVDLANTKWGVIETSILLSKQEAPSPAQRILRSGDTIVGTVRPGNGSYSYINTNGLTGSTGFAVLRPKKLQYREMVYLAATNRENIERLSHLADGGAYPAVRPDVVLNTPITLAKYELIFVFSKSVSPWITMIENNKSESRTLAQLRDLLLPKLLSGEIRIKDAENLIGNAV